MRFKYRVQKKYRLVLGSSASDEFNSKIFPDHLKQEQVEKELKKLIPHSSFTIKMLPNVITHPNKLPDSPSYVSCDYIPEVIVAHCIWTEDFNKHEGQFPCKLKIGDKFTYCMWTEYNEEGNEDNE